MKQSMRALRAVTAMLLAAALTGSLSACRREETPGQRAGIRRGLRPGDKRIRRFHHRQRPGHRNRH